MGLVDETKILDLSNFLRPIDPHLSSASQPGQQPKNSSRLGGHSFSKTLEEAIHLLQVQVCKIGIYLTNSHTNVLILQNPKTLYIIIKAGFVKNACYQEVNSQFIDKILRKVSDFKYKFLQDGFSFKNKSKVQKYKCVLIRKVLLKPNAWVIFAGIDLYWLFLAR